jgi:hypothetical protein
MGLHHRMTDQVLFEVVNNDMTLLEVLFKPSSAFGALPNGGCRTMCTGNHQSRQ